MVKIVSRYDVVSSSGVEFTQPSLTQQHFKDDCDVNLILERFMRTGELPSSSSSGVPSFQDVSDFGDFRDLQSAMSDARDYFESLPARVRARYNNDLTIFYESLSTRQGYDAFVTLVGAQAHTAPGEAGGVSEAEAERTQLDSPPLDVNVLSDTKKQSRDEKGRFVSRDVVSKE